MSTQPTAFPAADLEPALQPDLRANRASISSAEKKIMLEGRLKRRMQRSELSSFRGVLRLSFRRQWPRREEMVHLIDAVTTNKTDFFRETAHFDFLVAQGASGPRRRGTEARREVLIWSAGCSTGEEPYTLAMVLSEYAQAHPGFRFRFWRPTSRTAVLAKAELGVFQRRGGAPGAGRTAAQILHAQPGPRVGPAAGGSGIARR